MIANAPSISLTTGGSFSPQSKVWMYTAERPLTPDEQAFAQEHLRVFARDWTAHNQALKATTDIFAHQVILLVVDEGQAGASGCSIDKSVHFLEKLSQQMGIDLFDRMRFGWLDAEGSTRFNSAAELREMKATGTIDDSTLMFNSLAPTLSELEGKTWIELGKGWHRRVI